MSFTMPQAAGSPFRSRRSLYLWQLPPRAGVSVLPKSPLPFVTALPARAARSLARLVEGLDIRICFALQAPGTLLVSLVPEPPLLVFPGFRNHLAAEVPGQMEAAADDRQMGMALEEGPLGVGIHVACDACGPGHPFLSGMVAEIVGRLLLLAVGQPRHVPRLQADGRCRMPVPVMQPGLVYPEMARLPVRSLRPQPAIFAGFGAEGLEPGPADGLHDVLAQAGHERDCLEGLAERQQVLHEAEERHRQAVSGRPEGHALDA